MGTLCKQMWARMRHCRSGCYPVGLCGKGVFVFVNVWLWARYMSTSGGDVFESSDIIVCDKLCIYPESQWVRSMHEKDQRAS